MSSLRAQSRETRLLLALVIPSALFTLLFVSATAPRMPDPVRLGFWILITLIAAALPVRLPSGLHAAITMPPVLGAIFDPALPNPLAACWVAFVGTLEPRDIRRELPWFGSLYNRSDKVLSALVAWAVFAAFMPLASPSEPLAVIVQISVTGSAYAATNFALAMLAAAARTGTPLRRIWASVSQISVGVVAQVPLGWLMAEILDKVGYWAAGLFIAPLLLARYSFTKYTELRELFFGSVSALSQAIDAKDGFTRGHADRVSRIGGAIARELGLPERDIEQIELAGMLHDIGKIGIEDRILMKPTRLDPDEFELMKRHSIYGASILEPSTSLRPLVPIVRHHHERYDGAGYPDGLKGEGIPVGSRVIIVADAYEAMTSDRIYRKAMGHERAMEQLQRYKGTQFDPKVVRALEQLLQKRGPSAFDVSDLPLIEYETLAQLRQRLGPQHAAHDAHAG